MTYIYICARDGQLATPGFYWKCKDRHVPAGGGEITPKPVYLVMWMEERGALSRSDRSRKRPQIFRRTNSVVLLGGAFSRRNASRKKKKRPTAPAGETERGTPSESARARRGRAAVSTDVIKLRPPSPTAAAAASLVTVPRPYRGGERMPTSGRSLRSRRARRSERNKTPLRADYRL